MASSVQGTSQDIQGQTHVTRVTQGCKSVKVLRGFPRGYFNKSIVYNLEGEIRAFPANGNA